MPAMSGAQALIREASRRRGIAEGHRLRPKFARLIGEQSAIASRAQGHDIEALGAQAHDIEGTSSDGAG